MPPNPATDRAAELILSSYRHWTGQALTPARDDVDWTYAHAPFALLAHGSQAEPLFIYANLAAQRLFEYSLEQMLGLPSYLSAPQAQREARSALLRQVERDGLVRDYRGLRVSRTGRRFWIERTTVWKLLDGAGRSAGLAALIPDWSAESEPAPGG